MKGLGFRCSGVILILLTAIYFLLTPALAHVPVFGEGGKSYETAIFIENPAKSRVLYAVLHQLDQKIIYPHYDFKHLTEKYFEIGMKLDDFLIQLVKY